MEEEVLEGKETERPRYRMGCLQSMKIPLDDDWTLEAEANHHQDEYSVRRSHWVVSR